MSAPRVIVEMFVTGIKIFGKATSAAGSQAVRNFKHKPDGAPSSSPAGTGSSKSQITNQMQMSLDEAHLILNSKKEDALEVIEKNFETIFKANGPPAEPAPSAKPTAPTPAASREKPTSRKSKQPQYSHYLQSKVYRALERIKAERDTGAPPPTTAETGAGAAAEGTTATPPPPGTGSSTAPPGGTTL